MIERRSRQFASEELNHRNGVDIWIKNSCNAILMMVRNVNFASLKSCRSIQLIVALINKMLHELNVHIHRYDAKNYIILLTAVY